MIQWLTWQNTRHARAIRTLKPGGAAEAKKLYDLDITKGYTKDPKCIKCHVTGPGSISSPFKNKYPDYETKTRDWSKIHRRVPLQKNHGPLDSIVDISLAVDPPAFNVAGELAMNYRYRSRTSRGTDTDFYSYLSLDGGRRNFNDLTFHLLRRLLVR